MRKCSRLYMFTILIFIWTFSLLKRRYTQDICTFVSLYNIYINLYQVVFNLLSFGCKYSYLSAFVSLFILLFQTYSIIQLCNTFLFSKAFELFVFKHHNWYHSYIVFCFEILFLCSLIKWSKSFAYDWFFTVDTHISVCV